MQFSPNTRSQTSMEASDAQVRETKLLSSPANEVAPEIDCISFFVNQ